MSEFASIVKKNVFGQNPVFVQLLGMCPTLAVTTTALNGFSMGLAVTLVLICSNWMISLLRKIIPSAVRIAAYIVIISSFVTTVQLLIKAYLPSVDAALGIFIPLIVVNCIVLGRAEAFASKNPPLLSVADGLGTGLGFTLALVAVGFVREFLGSGTILGGTPWAISVPGFHPMLLFVLPAGAFLTLGFLVAAIQAAKNRKENRAFRKEDRQ